MEIVAQLFKEEKERLDSAFKKGKKKKRKEKTQWGEIEEEWGATFF